MKRYIDKDALAAEIEKRIKNLHELGNDDFLNMYYEKQYGSVTAYRSLLSFLNTLEVKEVDLENLREELDKAVKIYKPNGDFGWGTLYNIAKHFFELGIKAAQNENKSCTTNE